MDFNTESNSGKSKKRKRPASDGGPNKASKTPGQRPASSPRGEFNFRNPVGAFVSAVRGVVLSPARFLRDLPRWGDFVSPLVFRDLPAADRDNNGPRRRRQSTPSWVRPPRERP